MTESQDNVSRTRAFVHRVQEEGRIDLYDSFIHPEFLDHTALDASSADRESGRVMLGELHAALADRKVEIVHCFGHDDLVATTKIISGRHVGEWHGQPPTGERVSLLIMDFMRYRDGQVIEHWGAFRPLAGPPSTATDSAV